MKETAEMMAHSLSTQKKYIVPNWASGSFR
jgi:hypothetical protein